MKWIFVYMLTIWTVFVAGCVWVCPFWELKLLFAMILPLGPAAIVNILRDKLL